MGFAGVEEDSGSVVLEVAESVSDSFDSFDEVVHGFGYSVGVVAQVVGEDLFLPGVQGSPEFAYFRWHRPFVALIDEFFEYGFGVVVVGLVVELSEAFFDPVGDGNFALGVT